jgi:hypothetical protein
MTVAKIAFRRVTVLAGSSPTSMPFDALVAIWTSLDCRFARGAFAIRHAINVIFGVTSA